jgi:hypothetical protein
MVSWPIVAIDQKKIQETIYSAEWYASFALVTDIRTEQSKESEKSFEILYVCTAVCPTERVPIDRDL